MRRLVTRSTSFKEKEILQDTQKELQEAEAVLQETQKLDEERSKQQETKREDPELRQPIRQPNLESYYIFIKGARVIPKNFVIMCLLACC